jgi:hypothetical protein
LYRAIKNTQTAERFTSLRARLMEKASS